MTAQFTAGKRWAVTGRIVTMAGEQNVIESGTIFVQDNSIAAVTKAGDPRPAGFEKVEPISIFGTIFPSLIELHNHLSYNILPLWAVPEKFKDRNVWQRRPSYASAVKEPMKTIALAGAGLLLPAVVRYAEAKCLLGGVTTSQGITLSNWSGTIRRFYKGVLRTVEIGAPPQLPAARAKIPDFDPKEWADFKSDLQKSSCYIRHLSEGTDDKSRSHFLAFRNAQGEWALGPQLAGIHCNALLPEDFDVLAKHKVNVVWSPLSNFLLYGETANIAAVRKAGLTIALGPDWSPSGSKSLLGELKVAKAVNDMRKLGFSNYEIVSMATSNPARILKWDTKLGTIEKGKLADFIVVNRKSDDPYLDLIKAKENDISLVVSNGKAVYGLAALMSVLAEPGERLEPVEVAGTKRLINFDAAEEDPDIDKVDLADATKRLKKALADLGTLQIKSLEVLRQLDDATLAPRPGWRLTLDEELHGGEEERELFTLSAKPPPLHPIILDPLTAVDDLDFLPSLKKQMNLPAGLADELSKYF